MCIVVSKAPLGNSQEMGQHMKALELPTFRKCTKILTMSTDTKHEKMHHICPNTVLPTFNASILVSTLVKCYASISKEISADGSPLNCLKGKRATTYLDLSTLRMCPGNFKAGGSQKN